MVKRKSVSLLFCHTSYGTKRCILRNERAGK